MRGFSKAHFMIEIEKYYSISKISIAYMLLGQRGFLVSFRFFYSALPPTHHQTITTRVIHLALLWICDLFSTNYRVPWNPIVKIHLN